MNQVHLERWRVRLQRAAGLISQRMDDPPTLEELASAAAVSPFHFHRVWRALTGETVAEAVRRLRLEMSQKLLQENGVSVTATAMAVGFGTPQSFARAFRRHTGRTPSELARSSRNATPELLPHQVIVEVREGILVVALRRCGDAYDNLNSAFGQLWSWAEASGNLRNLAGIYGVPMDDPFSVADSDLRYDACLDIGQADAPASFRLIMLPSGDHACVRLSGPYDGLEAATQVLVGVWLPLSGREPADFPAYYMFLNDPEETPAEALQTLILLPLAPETKDGTCY